VHDARDGEKDVVLELISGANYSRGQEVFIRCVCVISCCGNLIFYEHRT